MLLTKNLHRIPNYLKRFGLLQGVRLFIQVYGLRPVLRVRGYPHPIYLRHSASDSATFFQIIVKEEYDSQHWPQYIKLLRSYDAILNRKQRPIIIDGGGNIGLTAIWFAKIFPRALIITIEPNVENVGMIRRNVIGYDNIRVIHGGVWHRSCRLRITDPTAGSAMFRVEEAEDGDFKGYSLEELAAIEPGSELFIVKLDIEGSEATLFASNTDWVARVPLIAIETHDWLFPGQASSRTFWSCVAKLNADVLFRGENVFVFTAQ